MQALVHGVTARSARSSLRARAAVGLAATLGVLGSPVLVAAAGGPGAWTSVSAPVGAPLSQTLVELSATSCPARRWCAAVGAARPTASDPTRFLPVAELEVTGAWTTSPLPLPPDADATAPDGTLTAVSCPAAGSCVAVGEYTTTSGTEAGLIETLAGGTWTASGAPVPAGAGGPGRAFLASVSCATASSCSAVGSARSAGGDTTTPLWVSLGPGGWTATSVPSVPGTQATSFLVGVSCPGAGTCVAVGSAADGTGGAVPVVVTETAAGMDSQLAPLPAAADRAASGNHLVAVACGAPATCVAVGAYVDASGTGWALAVDGRGASWSDAALPLPPGEFSTGGVLESDLVAVACGGPASCVAVGSYWSPAGQLSPLAVSSAGSGWGLDAVAIPTAPPTSRPAAGTPATATAAASTTAPTGAATTSAATGTVGTAATGNAWGGALQAVACASAGRCTAVGQYWKAGGGSGAMAQSLATGSWSASGGPSPAQATPTAGGASWSSVACVATSCTAVGDYLAATGAALGVLSSSV